ncbi:hypothetical protein LTV02_11760 [Nocardia yamanashiensis]|uniref:hypothetical protein n=1 Tax=Nocardia yamanashiensis TaxID=209247 RepID=UPI001E310A0E|nr:hypothetical protein [Nocardia yamanashiensis]UGT44011.1 hypothetical protein LTV02_11760 [Nocardia yamanashiensis]
MGWYGAGRFLRPGDSPPGESVAEGSIYAILNFVLGTGTRNYRVAGRYELRADMMFMIGNREGHPLVVEYDGAFWHRDREETDTRKICETRSLSERHDIIRLRQQPLPRLQPADISFPRKADAMTCARLALLHITHRPKYFAPEDAIVRRIHRFLSFGAIPLQDDWITCDACLELNDVLQEHHSFTHQLDRNLRNSGRSRFVELAAEHSQLGEYAEDIWHPDNRKWELAETRLHEKRGFRARLYRQREAERPPPPPPSPVGSTIPLITKQESGWVEGP